MNLLWLCKHCVYCFCGIFHYVMDELDISIFALLTRTKIVSHILSTVLKMEDLLVKMNSMIKITLFFVYLRVKIINVTLSILS